MVKLNNLLDKYKEKENNISLFNTDFNDNSNSLNFSISSAINDGNTLTDKIKDNKEIANHQYSKLFDCNLCEKNKNFKINNLFNFINKWQYISKDINNKNDVKISFDPYEIFIKNKIDIVIENLFNELKKDKIYLDTIDDENITNNTINDFFMKFSEIIQ